jgi:hypothetical protein
MNRINLATVAIAAAFFQSAAIGLASQPQVTEDGLVLMPSSHIGLVYRAPHVSFARYRRVIVDPVGVAFKRTWERDHKKMKSESIEELRQRAAESFHEEIVNEIVKRGKFELADRAAPDVLRVRGYIVRLDITAPEAGTIQNAHTYLRSAGTMTLVVELHDAASGAIIARIIDGEQSNGIGNLQQADQIFNSAEARLAFINGARLTHEAINVAQTERETN